MRQEFAKNALVVTLKRASRGNAWHARRGNKRMRSWQNMQAHRRHVIVFVRLAKKTQLCSSCDNRKEQNRFSAAVWERPRGGGRVCLDCLSKAWSRWSCSLCKVKQPASAYETWMAQHRSLNGDQVCDNCRRCLLPRGVVRKAAERVAATQAKVARKVAKEKKTRVVADVCAAIAERKRKREQDIA